MAEVMRVLGDEFKRVLRSNLKQGRAAIRPTCHVMEAFLFSIYFVWFVLSFICAFTGGNDVAGLPVTPVWSTDWRMHLIAPVVVLSIGMTVWYGLLTWFVMRDPDRYRRTR